MTTLAELMPYLNTPLSGGNLNLPINLGFPIIERSELEIVILDSEGVERTLELNPNVVQTELVCLLYTSPSPRDS